MELYKAIEFKPHVQSHFTIAFDDGLSVSIELTECVVRPRGVPKDFHGNEVAGHPNDRPFSLIFKGPAEPALPQRHYNVTHPELGALGIFLVPVSDIQNDGRYYEAIFN